jgi:hypothetical protein
MNQPVRNLKEQARPLTEPLQNPEDRSRRRFAVISARCDRYCEPRLDGEAFDAIVSDGVHKVAVTIRTYNPGGYGRCIGTPVHLQ